MLNRTKVPYGLVKTAVSLATRPRAHLRQVLDDVSHSGARYAILRRRRRRPMAGLVPITEARALFEATRADRRYRDIHRDLRRAQRRPFAGKRSPKLDRPNNPMGTIRDDLASVLGLTSLFLTGLFVLAGVLRQARQAYAGEWRSAVRSRHVSDDIGKRVVDHADHGKQELGIADHGGRQAHCRKASARRSSWLRCHQTRP